MTPARPYLLRAMHAWISDNGLTPYLLVRADAQGVEVPPDYVVDSKIILNVSATAVRLLNITNDCVSFSARFNNRPRDIIVPLAAVEAIYAKENGQGMVFSDDDQPTTGSPPAGPDPARGRRPALTIVK